MLFCHMLSLRFTFLFFVFILRRHRRRAFEERFSQLVSFWLMLLWERDSTSLRHTAARLVNASVSLSQSTASRWLYFAACYLDGFLRVSFQTLRHFYSASSQSRTESIFYFYFFLKMLQNRFGLKANLNLKKRLVIFFLFGCYCSLICEVSASSWWCSGLGWCGLDQATE